MSGKFIYMDNHSTTAVDPEVVKVMLPYFTEFYGNPSGKGSVKGMEASSAVEHSRKIIAEYFNASNKDDIYFTGGATESINLFHLGSAKANKSGRKKVVTSIIEHSAVSGSLEQLKKYGYDIHVLGVDASGSLNYDELESAVDENTFLVSIMAVNNEIGTLNDLKRIGEICKKKGVLFHTDASQGVGKIKIDVEEMKIDALSFTGHKFYAPKGIGGLYIKNRNKVNVEPLVFGGGQEKGLRPGTLNVPYIAGLGKAFELLSEKSDEVNRITLLRDKLQDNLVKNLKNVVVNGDEKNRVCGNLNISFLGIRSENFISSIRSIAVSSGAACSSGKAEKSHVLRALKIEDEVIDSAIRFGIGRFNTEEEIETASKIIIEKINELREKSPVYQLKYQE